LNHDAIAMASFFQRTARGSPRIYTQLSTSDIFVRRDSSTESCVHELAFCLPNRRSQVTIVRFDSHGRRWSLNARTLSLSA
jgi:hypothetical protein